MSWLYDRRDQLDGLRPFVEIAYHVTYGIDPCDRDDVEQDIVIALILVSQKRKEPAYLWGVARKEVKRYWCKKCYRGGKFRPFYEDEDFASQGEDNDARLDALAVLATLPDRLVEIGYERLNGKKLNAADQGYWMRHKAKLGCRKRGDQLSDWEKRRVVRLHGEGMSVYKIAKAMGRSTTTIGKVRGSPVQTDVFLDQHYKYISAILFSNVDAANPTKSMGDDFIIVYNPLAHSLPDDFQNFGQQWKAELRGNEVRVSLKG